LGLVSSVVDGLRKLDAVQQAEVSVDRGVTDWFMTDRGVRQRCL